MHLEGKILELWGKCTTMQKRLPSSNTSMNKFKQLMQKGNGALRLLSNNRSKAILLLSNKALKLLQTKHPKLKLLIQKLYCRAKKPIHSAVFDDTNEQVNWKAAIKKGGCGQSGLDADNSRRVLTSRSLGFSSVDLRKYFANFFKIICIKYIHISEAGPDNSLET